MDNKTLLNSEEPNETDFTFASAYNDEDYDLEMVRVKHHPENYREKLDEVGESPLSKKTMFPVLVRAYIGEGTNDIWSITWTNKRKTWACLDIVYNLVQEDVVPDPELAKVKILISDSNRSVTISSPTGSKTFKAIEI